MAERAAKSSAARTPGHQMCTRSSGGRYSSSSGVTLNALYHASWLRTAPLARNISGLCGSVSICCRSAASREAALRQQMLTDPHSPEMFRANGAVRNQDAWYKAFNVTPDDELYLPPEERVHIW